MSTTRVFVVDRHTKDFLQSRLIDPILQAALEKASIVNPVHNRSTIERFEVVLTREEQHLMVECLLDLFCNIGLHTDDEPNEVGRYIEDLIDHFNPHVSE